MEYNSYPEKRSAAQKPRQSKQRKFKRTEKHWVPVERIVKDNKGPIQSFVPDRNLMLINRKHCACEINQGNWSKSTSSTTNRVMLTYECDSPCGKEFNFEYNSTDHIDKYVTYTSSENDSKEHFQYFETQKL